MAPKKIFFQMIITTKIEIWLIGDHRRKYTVFIVCNCFKDVGGNSQNFLSQICKIFCNFGP